jgi:membrane-associated phospholipid phosphatase
MSDRARLRTWGTTGALSLLLMAVCIVITRDGTVPSAERDVFRAINELPDALETPMVLATGVAFSRIYLGVHNSLDVVAGAAGGLLIAAALNLVLLPDTAIETRGAPATTASGV